MYIHPKLYDETPKRGEHQVGLQTLVSLVHSGTLEKWTGDFKIYSLGSNLFPFKSQSILFLPFNDGQLLYRDKPLLVVV